MTLKEFVEQNPNLVQMKESTRYPGLFVLKYKRRVFYDNLWNEFLEECRGTVVDKDFNVVIRPFTKIYNRFERDTDIGRDEQVLAIRKVNGFMAAATYVPALDKVIVSTTGSLDSEFADMAEEYITDDVKDVIKNSWYLNNRVVTFMFEIVHPNDPHIIKEDVGAWLIGGRRIDEEDSYLSCRGWESLLDRLAKNMKVKRPEWFTARFSDVALDVKTVKHEGYVVYSEDKALKIKSPYYLMTKFLARCGTEKLMKLNRDQLRQTLDEEYYGVIDRVCADKENFAALDEQSRINVIAGWLKNAD